MSAKRILILEDHQGLAQLIHDQFKAHGFEVDLCMNGQQGLEKAQAGGYAAIISDIKMPLLDGIGFLKALQENPPSKKNGPIIMYSNFAYQYSKDQVLALGAVDFVAKDAIGTNELIEIVKSHIR